MEFLECAGKYHSENCRYVYCETDSARPHNAFPIILISLFKIVQLCELMVLSITRWVEVEASYTFSNPTGDLTQTWFGTHIFRNYTRLIIFWDK